MRAELDAAGVDVAHVLIRDRPTGVALIVVDREGENQIVVCEGANAQVDLDGVVFAESEAVLTQLEIPMEAVVELAGRVEGSGWKRRNAR